MSYLAHEHSPEQADRVGRGAGTGSKAYYASQFQQVFGRSLGDAWRDWIAWEREFQQAEPRRASAPTRTTPARGPLGAGPRLGLARLRRPRTRKMLYAALNYPGVVAHVGAISLEDGSVAQDRRRQGPAHLHRHLPRLRSRLAGRSSTPRTTTPSATSCACRPDARQTSRMLIKDARIGDLVFNPPTARSGASAHFNGLATLVRIPHPYKRVAAGSTPGPTARWSTTSTSRPTARSSRSRTATIERPRSRCASWRSRRCSRATRRPSRSFDFGTRDPVELRVLPGRPVPLRQLVLHRRLEHLPLRPRDAGRSTRVSNTETGFFRPLPLGGDSLVVFRYTGEGFVPARSRRKPLEDVSAITFLGQQIAEKHPVVKDWKRRLAAAVPLDSLITGQGGYSRSGASGSSRSTRSSRATRTSRPSGMRVELLRPAAPQPREPDRVLHPRLRPARERALPPAGRATSATTGRAGSS